MPAAPVAGTVEAAEARRAAHQEHRQLVVAAVVEVEGEVDAVRGEAADHGPEAVAVRHGRRAERGLDRDLDPDGAGLDLHAGAAQRDVGQAARHRPAGDLEHGAEPGRVAVEEAPVAAGERLGSGGVGGLRRHFGLHGHPSRREEATPVSRCGPHLGYKGWRLTPG